MIWEKKLLLSIKISAEKIRKGNLSNLVFSRNFQCEKIFLQFFEMSTKNKSFTACDFNSKSPNFSCLRNVRNRQSVLGQRIEKFGCVYLILINSPWRKSLLKFDAFQFEFCFWNLFDFFGLVSFHLLRFSKTPKL